MQLSVARRWLWFIGCGCGDFVVLIGQLKPFDVSMGERLRIGIATAVEVGLPVFVSRTLRCSGTGRGAVRGNVVELYSAESRGAGLPRRLTCLCCQFPIAGGAHSGGIGVRRVSSWHVTLPVPGAAVHAK
jgi:hypothetical protein